MRKILIAVPCMDQLPAQFAHSLATLTSYGIEDTQISIWFNLGSLIYTSRDQIAKKALLGHAQEDARTHRQRGGHGYGHLLQTDASILGSGI